MSISITQSVDKANIEDLVMKSESLFDPKVESDRMQRKMLEKYYAVAKKHDFEIPVEYNSEQCNTKGCVKHPNRFKPNLPNGWKVDLGGLRNNVRSTIHHGKQWDYDMVCCHPTLLSQWCHKNGEPCPYLDQYLLDYPALKAKDEGIKYALLKLMNGGGLEGKYKKDTRMKALKDEITRLFKDIIIPSYSEWQANIDALPRKQQPGRFRHFCSVFSQGILERDALVAFKNACDELGVKVSTLIHDGMLVDKELTQSDLNKIIQHMKSAIGMEVQIELKDHSADVIDTSAITVDTIIETDLEAANYILHTYYGIDKKFIRAPDNYYAVYEGVWEKGEEAIEKLIFKLPPIFKFQGDKKKAFSHMVAGMRSIRSALCTISPITPDFYQQINLATLDKVYYLDKFWDLKERCWKPCDIVPLARVPKKAPVANFQKWSQWQEEHEGEGEGEMHPEVLEVWKYVSAWFSTQSELDYLFFCMARALGGNIKDKVWHILHGARHSGKSRFQGMVTNAFGKQYVTNGQIPVESNSSQDEAQSHRWILTLNHTTARVSFCNELRRTIAGKDPRIDGDKIKKLIASGGDDEVTARLHGGNECSVMVNTTTFWAVNNIPKSTLNDAFETTRVHLFPYRFEKSDPRNKIKKNSESADQTKARLAHLEDAFTYLIFQAYKDEPARSAPMGEDAAGELQDLLEINPVRKKDIILEKWIEPGPGNTPWQQLWPICAKMFTSKTAFTRFLKAADYPSQRSNGQKVIRGCRLTSEGLAEIDRMEPPKDELDC